VLGSCGPRWNTEPGRSRQLLRDFLPLPAPDCACELCQRIWMSYEQLDDTELLHAALSARDTLGWETPVA